MKNYLFNTLKDNKGYMLVEIILASAIAFLIAYFAIDLTIKVKEKNDDLYVHTLVTTDRSIVTNGLMKVLQAKGAEFDCTKIVVSNKRIGYDNTVINTVNSNINIGKVYCDMNEGVISIKIPLSVEQIPSENFDVDINYKYVIPRIPFTFTIVDVKTGIRQIGGIDYEIQIKNGDNWIPFDSGRSVSKKDFNSDLSIDQTYRVKTSSNLYPVQHSYEFTSHPDDPTHIDINIFKGNANEILVTLDWNRKLDDLDMHLYANNNFNSERYHLWGSASQTARYLGIGGATLDVDSNTNITNKRNENMTIDRDAIDFEIWVFNWGQFCYKRYGNDCMTRYRLSASNNNPMAYGEPQIYVFDGGGGDGSRARWVYYPDNFSFPASAPGSNKLTWKVFKYSKADHSFTIINEFTDYPKGTYASS